MSTRSEICTAIVHKIIHKDLNMRKIWVKFAPRVLNDQQKKKHVEGKREMVKIIIFNPRTLESLGKQRRNLDLLWWSRDQEDQSA